MQTLEEVQGGSWDSVTIINKPLTPKVRNCLNASQVTFQFCCVSVGHIFVQLTEPSGSPLVNIHSVVREGFCHNNILKRLGGQSVKLMKSFYSSYIFPSMTQRQKQ